MNDCRDLFPTVPGIQLRSEVRVTVQRPLAGTLVRLADTLAEDFEIARFLGMLAEYRVEYARRRCRRGGWPVERDFSVSVYRRPL